MAGTGQRSPAATRIAASRGLAAALAVAATALALVPTDGYALRAEQNGIDHIELFTALGWTDVEIVQRSVRHVLAEACRDGRRERVRIDLVSGRARRSGTIALCRDRLRDAGEASMPPPQNAKDSAMRTLEQVGYTGVRLSRQGRDGWRGTACRDGTLYEIGVGLNNAPGPPLRAVRPCPPERSMRRDFNARLIELPLRDADEAERFLGERGYSQIGRMVAEENLFTTMACRGRSRYALAVHRRGVVVARRMVGRCGDADQ